MVVVVLLTVLLTVTLTMKPPLVLVGPGCCAICATAGEVRDATPFAQIGQFQRQLTKQ
jgi:hypothetical protein